MIRLRELKVKCTKGRAIPNRGLGTFAGRFTLQPVLHLLPQPLPGDHACHPPCSLAFLRTELVDLWTR